MHINISDVSISSEEHALVSQVLQSGNLAQGRIVAELETKFGDLVGAKHVVATSSGTTALQLALEVAGVGPGDEVITSPFTFVATLNSILTRGAIARLVDIDPVTFNVRPDLVEGAISDKTKAIMPVHLYGLLADMDRIRHIAEKHNLRVVEDAAQAHFATQGGYSAGTLDLGCFSLYATKNLSAGEGGLITVQNAADSDRLRVLRNQGMRNRYEYVAVGYNYRLTDLAAALALAQLPRLSDVITARRRNAAFLTSALRDLPGVVAPSVPTGYAHVWHQYTLRLSQEAPLTRGELADVLAAHGVGTGIYYPKILPDHRVFAEHPNVIAGNLPDARRVASEVISLPVHQGLSDTDLHQIADAVTGAFKGR